MFLSAFKKGRSFPKRKTNVAFIAGLKSLRVPFNVVETVVGWRLNIRIQTDLFHIVAPAHNLRFRI